MKIRHLVSLVALLTLPAAAVAWTPVADLIQVEDPYVRAVPPGQPNSAAFLSLRNSDDQPHEILYARSPAAAVVELHTHINNGGLLKMRRIPAIELPPGKVTRLAPGGLHIMLIKLHKELKPGDEVRLTLVFDDDSEMALQAPVRRIMVMDRPGGH